MADLSGVGTVSPAKVDFTYAIDDLSDVSYVDIGNKIRKFAAQKAPYFAIVDQLSKLSKTQRAAKMAAKFKVDLNYYVLSPQFDYKQPAYLLSYPGRNKIKVHSMELEQTRDSLVEEALALMQQIIQAGDIEIEGADNNTFRTDVSASKFGIGPKGGNGVITIDTGRPDRFIYSLIGLFKQASTVSINETLTPIVIKKYIPDFMSTL